jgi:hypothetical protein
VIQERKGEISSTKEWMRGVRAVPLQLAGHHLFQSGLCWWGALLQWNLCVYVGRGVQEEQGIVSRRRCRTTGGISSTKRGARG